MEEYPDWIDKAAEQMADIYFAGSRVRDPHVRNTPGAKQRVAEIIFKHWQEAGSPQPPGTQQAK